MKKKTLLTLGTLVSLVPAVSVISCSTTWTKWTKNKDAMETHTVFKRDHLPAFMWKVRQSTELMRAWNGISKTLDMSKVYNQYELLDILSMILKLKTSESIDMYWNKYADFKTFMSNVQKVQEFHIGSKTYTWDVDQIINDVIDGIDNYDPTDTRQQDPDTHQYPVDYKGKEFDVEKNGLDSKTNQPKDFNEVALHGTSLITNPLVSSLLSFDGAFALSMSKLVNLPQKSFVAVGSLLTKMNELIDWTWEALTSDDATKTEEENKSESSFIKGWDFTASPINGKSKAVNLPDKNPYTSFLKGMLLIESFKN